LQICCNVSLEFDKNNGYMTLMPMYIYDYISLNSSNKICGENQNTQFMFNNFLLCRYCHIMWKNTVELGKRQKAIRRMRFACWITKATNTYSEYLILIASPLQKCLHERVSILRHMYLPSCSLNPRLK